MSATLSSLLFCCLELLGLLFGYISVFPVSGQSSLWPSCIELHRILLSYRCPCCQLIDVPTQNLLCILRPTVVSLAFVLVISGIVFKSYRTYHTFNNVFAFRMGIRDSALARFVFFLVILNVVSITLWFAADPPFVEHITIQPGVYYYNCASKWLRISDNGTSVFELLLVLYLISLEIYAVFLAYKTRNISSTWSEEKCIAYAS